MAYLDEQAQTRELMRQQLLAGKSPFNLPGLDPRVEQLGLFQMAPPQGVKVDAPQQMQVPVYQRTRPGTSSPAQQSQDNSLGQALDGIFKGGGGGIKDMLRRMQESRAVPSGSAVRGTNLAPPAGTEQAAPGNARVQAPGGGRTPEQMIPGLQQPFDAKEQVPNAAAVKAYYDERAPGGAVKGVEKPAGSTAAEPLAQGEVSSEILANQRKDYASQIESNPALKEKMGALMLAEEGGDSTARTALAESAANRGVSRNVGSLDAVLDPKYYQPMSDGSGNYDKALQRYRSDPKLRAQVNAEMDRAFKGGSNVSNLATDNASGKVAANSKTNQTPTWTAGNGEGFFRKDIRPDVHGAKAVASTKDWHNNTTAAMVDEKPGAAAPAKVASADSAVPGGESKPAPAQTLPAGEGTPGQPPGWLKDAVGTYAAEKGMPPGDLGAVGTPTPTPQAQLTPELLREKAPPQSTLTPENLKAAGEKILADRPATPVEPGNLDPGRQPAVQDAQGNISTVRTIGINEGGKEVNIPTVSPDGRIMTNDQAVQQYRDSGKHLGKFDTPEAAGKAAEALHQQEAEQIGQVPKNVPPPTPEQQLLNPQPTPGAQEPPRPGQLQMTPEIAKALNMAVKAEDDGPAPKIPAEAQPVLPSEVAPAAPGAPGGPAMAGAPGAMTLPEGNAPVMMTQASQGNPIALAGLSPIAPVQGGPLTTPLSAEGGAAGVSPFQVWQAPIDFSTLQGWGWGGGGGGGFDFGGGGGGFDFGGGSGFTGWGSSFGGG